MTVYDSGGADENGDGDIVEPTTMDVGDTEAGEPDDAGAPGRVGSDTPMDAPSTDDGADGGRTLDANTGFGAAETSPTVDRCQPNPCGHGTCSATSQGFACKCNPGWEGTGTCNLNTNAALSGLDVSAGKLFPAFRRDVYEYSVDLRLGDLAFSLTPTVSVADGVELQVDGQAHRSGTPTPAYSTTINKPVTIMIESVADNGSRATYRVIVRRTLALQATLRTGLAGVTRFGRGIALSNGLLAASAETADRVDADLFTHSGRSWSWARAISGSAQTTEATNTPISMNEKWLVIGVPGSSSAPGVVKCYRRTELGSWGAPLEFSASGTSSFGKSLALDGDNLAVLSSYDLHMLDLSMPQAAALKLTPPTAPESVDIEGDLLVVSGHGNGDTTYAYYRRSGSWSLGGPLQDVNTRVFGGIVGIANGAVTIADTYLFVSVFAAAPQPVLHNFAPSGGSWSNSNTILPAFPTVSATVDPNGFGFSGIATTSDVLVVGAFAEGSKRHGIHAANEPFDPVPASARPEDGFGLAYVFMKTQSGWRLDAVIGPPQAPQADQQTNGFGYGVSYDGTLLAISAFGTVGGGSAGAIYVYGPDCGQVPQDAQVPGC